MSTLQDKLFQIAIELKSRTGMNIELYLDKSEEQNNVYFIIEIGSKTGTGQLMIENDQIVLKTRYGQIDTILRDDEFLDVYVCFLRISDIAWYWWDETYQANGYGPCDCWISTWKEQGRLKVETETVSEYRRS